MNLSTQPYRVGTGPLEIWAVVAIICALTLLAVAFVLWRSPRRAARWLLAVSLPGTLLAGVLAWRSWAAFQYYTPIGGCCWASPGVCERFYTDAAHVIAFVTVLGPSPSWERSRCVWRRSPYGAASNTDGAYAHHQRSQLSHVIAEAQNCARPGRMIK